MDRTTLILLLTLSGACAPFDLDLDLNTEPTGCVLDDYGDTFFTFGHSVEDSYALGSSVHFEVHDALPGERIQLVGDAFELTENSELTISALAATPGTALLNFLGGARPRVFFFEVRPVAGVEIGLSAIQTIALGESPAVLLPVGFAVDVPLRFLDEAGNILGGTQLIDGAVQFESYAVDHIQILAESAGPGSILVESRGEAMGEITYEAAEPAAIVLADTFSATPIIVDAEGRGILANVEVSIDGLPFEPLRNRLITLDSEAAPGESLLRVRGAGLEEEFSFDSTLVLGE